MEHINRFSIHLYRAVSSVFVIILLFLAVVDLTVSANDDQERAVMIVLDASGSMYFDITLGGYDEFDSYYEGEPAYINTRMFFVKNALIEAVEREEIFRENDRFGLIHFGGSAYQAPIVDLEPTLGADRERLISAIEAVRTLKGTSWKEPIEQAGAILSEISSAVSKHIVFITDGDPQDDSNRGYFEAAQTLFESYGITLSTIVVSNDVSNEAKSNLQAMAAEGQFFECSTPEDISSAIDNSLKFERSSFEDSGSEQEDPHNDISAVEKSADKNLKWVILSFILFAAVLIMIFLLTKARKSR